MTPHGLGKALPNPSPVDHLTPLASRLGRSFPDSGFPLQTFASTSQPPMAPEVTDQVSPMDEDPPQDPSHVSSNPSDQITGEKGTTAGEGTTDKSPEGPAETRQTQDGEDADMAIDPDEGTSDPATGGDPSGSDPVPTPSTNKPKPKSVFVKVMELEADDMFVAWLQAFFDHYFYFDKSGGDLHGNISIDTIVYLEEQEKGGLLHLDPPVNMPDQDFNGYPRQRWIPGWDYDEKGEVIMDSRVNHEDEDLSQLPVDWYMEKSEEP